MATQFDDTSADHKWSTAANWSAGKPDAADAVTIGAAVTSLIVDEAATCLSIDMTGAAAAFVLSGTGTLAVAGNVTYKASSTTTMTHSGTITISDDCTFTSNGMTLGSAITFSGAGKTLTLADALNIATKTLTISAGTFASGNFNITCGTLSSPASTTRTLTLGSSTITCTNIDVRSTGLTVTANTAIINAGSAANLTSYFGTKTWGGTVTITISGGSYHRILDANTFANLTVILTPSATSGPIFLIDANQTVSGTFTLTGNRNADKTGCIRGEIRSDSPGTRRTITAANVAVTGQVDFRDIGGAGAGSWDLSGIASGDEGGNSGITFRTPHTYYLYAGTSSSTQDYNDVWSASDDGESRAAGGFDVFPLPQDTIIIDNYSWDDAGNSFVFHHGNRHGSVDASGLTEANTIGFPYQTYGSLIYTGSGITLSGTLGNPSIDARVKNEASTTLDINISGGAGNNNFTIRSYGGGGTVRLLTNNLTGVDTFTLTYGVFDLNGLSLSCKIFSSTNAYTRTLQATGGGKIVLNGLTGTIFDTTTATNLTISNTPAIDIGDSNNTLTGDVTFIGSAKAYGDFTVKKHAGDFDCIITGANDFAALTLETPDATYQYSDLKLTTGTDTDITSLVIDGTADYKPNLASTTSTHATISCASGAYTVTNCLITAVNAEGGATFNLGTGASIADDETGWTAAGGLSIPVAMHHYLHNMGRK